MEIKPLGNFLVELEVDEMTNKAIRNKFGHTVRKLV